MYLCVSQLVTFACARSLSLSLHQLVCLSVGLLVYLSIVGSVNQYVYSSLSLFACCLMCVILSVAEQDWIPCLAPSFALQCTLERHSACGCLRCASCPRIPTRFVHQHSSLFPITHYLTFHPPFANHRRKTRQPFGFTFPSLSVANQRCHRTDRVFITGG